MPSLADRLRRRIAAEGSLPLADFMAAANAHYYATRDPFGPHGDFVTAPEISQMFGELVGVWLADLWQRASPARTVHYVELGPGRGTLAKDALRVLGGFGLVPKVELVETSPVLRAAQAAAVPDARWHDAVETLPHDGPLLVLANEFFDALPVVHHVRGEQGWNERCVDVAEERFVPALGRDDTGAQVPADLRDNPVGSVYESSPASMAIVGTLAAQIVRQGGTMLIVDYGHDRTSIGETLQAVRGHAFADVFAEPGEQDLTAHVDFEALGRAARNTGAHVTAVQTQGAWLTSIGIGMREMALAKADPARQSKVFAARERLVGAAQMGLLFKVMAVTAPGWPEPAGF